LALFAVAGVSCKHLSTAGADNGEAGNPFFEASKLPLQAPDFTRIKDSDYQPALEEGMKQQQAEISKIADNTEAPTFENTLVAMEKSGQLLTRVNGVFNLVTSANTNPTLQKVQEEEAPKTAANNDAIFLNTKLFKRVQAIYQKRNDLKLDPESKRLVEYYEQKFELAGANLSESAKDTLKKYNQEEAGLSAKFVNMVLAANKAGALLVTDKSELAGLSDAEIQAAAENAKAAKQDGKWLLSLQNTTQQPLLQSLSNRATRQKLFEASYNRAEKGDANDTRKTIARIAELHALEAKLLGFKNYADWKLRDQMAQTPEAVAQFLGQTGASCHC
jgi:peptidyl-dipeptidase Dcp